MIDFLNVFYKRDLKNLELNSIFPHSTVFSEEIVLELIKALNSTHYFDKPKSLSKSSEEVNLSELDIKQSEAVNVQIGGHHLVKGVPGSGKSIAAVSRALHVVKNHPKWRVLLLCVNRKLADQNKLTLHERCRGLRHFGLKEGYFRSTTLMDFLQTNYNKKVNIRNYQEKIDFFTEELLKSGVERQWDYIIIDEYQDFSEDHLEVIKQSANLHNISINRKKRETENLFLVGDQLQQLDGSIGTHSWKDVGIHIQGRTIKLKSVYRNPSKIIDLALNYILDSSKAMKKEVISYYEGIDDLSKDNDTDAKIDFVSGEDLESISKVKSWIHDFVSHDIKFNDILIIHPDSKKTRDNVLTIFDEEIYNGVQIGMPSNIKGLESKIVIIWGIDQFKTHFNTETDKIKKIYMSLTRATKGILIHSHDDSNDDYQRILRLTEGILFEAA